MKTKVVRAGNSRALIIPSGVADELGWNVGKEVELEHFASALVVRTAPRRSWKRVMARVVRDHEQLIRELAKR